MKLPPARPLLPFAFALAALLAKPPPAVAVPREIVLLRHGEKQDAWALCSIGVQRSLALKAQYLGKGAANSLFAPGEEPAAFFVITLHSLEVVAPAAASWGLPLTNYAVVPLKGVAGVDEQQELDARTREAANDILTNPAWNGKTVVIAWEHTRIAKAKLEKAAAGSTFRELLHLDALGKKVPSTWSGTNYDYFWIVRYKSGSTTPSNFKAMKQDFAPPFDTLPHNDWGEPDNLPAASRCE